MLLASFSAFFFSPGGWEYVWSHGHVTINRSGRQAQDPRQERFVSSFPQRFFQVRRANTLEETRANRLKRQFLPKLESCRRFLRTDLKKEVFLFLPYVIAKTISHHRWSRGKASQGYGNYARYTGRSIRYISRCSWSEPSASIAGHNPKIIWSSAHAHGELCVRLWLWWLVSGPSLCFCVWLWWLVFDPSLCFCVWRHRMVRSAADLRWQRNWRSVDRCKSFRYLIVKG